MQDLLGGSEAAWGVPSLPTDGAFSAGPAARVPDLRPAKALRGGLLPVQEAPACGGSATGLDGAPAPAAPATMGGDAAAGRGAREDLGVWVEGLGGEAGGGGNDPSPNSMSLSRFPTLMCATPCPVTLIEGTPF